MIPRTQQDARAVADRYLSTQAAAVAHDGPMIIGTWDAGWRIELSYCRLRVLYAQVEAAVVDATAFATHANEVAGRAEPLSRRIFGRTLAVAAVAADQVDPDLEGSLSRFQIIGRTFVTPLLIDLGQGSVRTAAIGLRGNGFQPQREQLLRGLFAAPVTVS